MERFNKLSPAEVERLALLSEEMGEAQQAICKILRHGYGSYNPHDISKGDNRAMLELELGHVRHAMILLCSSGDVSKDNIHYCARERAETVKRYLHHQ